VTNLTRPILLTNRSEADAWEHSHHASLRETAEARTLLGRWREEYNQIRPHSALGYRPPAPQAWLFSAQPVGALGLTQQVVHTLGAGHSLLNIGLGDLATRQFEKEVD